MRCKELLLGCLIAGIGAGAFAHEGVKNPAVKARMHAMMTIGANTKALGRMANGAAPFEAQAARDAASSIAESAGQAPALFRMPETDPVSEARPAIWQNFDDFEAQLIALESAAARAAREMETIDDLRAVLPQIGAGCRTCHRTYRE